MLEGKTIFLWIVKTLYDGDPHAIALAAKRMGLTNVFVKVADGTWSYNLRPPLWKDDILPDLFEAFDAVGIPRWGWHFVYGYEPLREAQKAIERIAKYDLEGYILNAEAAYKHRPTQATALMTYIRRAYPDLPLALSSYRFPNYHREFPFEEFLRFCDYNMPQVYWIKNDNPVQQLHRCIEEYKQFTPVPMVPTGIACRDHDWQPTIQQMTDFHNETKDLGLPAISWWEWVQSVKTSAAGITYDTVIQSLQWEVDPPPPPPPPLTHEEEHEVLWREAEKAGWNLTIGGE